MDYNVQVDVNSALCVFQNSRPTLVPIAVTVETSLKRAYLDALKGSGPPCTTYCAASGGFAEDENVETQYGKTCDGVSEDTVNFQHDSLPCAIALGWTEGVKVQELPVTSQIEDEWLRQRVEKNGEPTKIVTDVNGPAFNKFWLNTVTGRERT
jgi:inosine-uridine nucleoside N-ribohydrolase